MSRIVGKFSGITVNKTAQTVESAAASDAFHIEDVFPLIDGGRFAVKRIVGERVEVRLAQRGELRLAVARALGEDQDIAAAREVRARL